MALQTSSATYRYPGVNGTFPWVSREGRTGTRPYQKSEPEFKFSAKRISLQSSAQVEALRPDSCIQDRGTRKIGWDSLKGGGEIKGGQQNLLFLNRSGHPGQLSTSGGDQGQTSPSCGHWVRSVGRQAGPGVPQAVWMSAPVKMGVSLHGRQLL